MYLEKCSVDGRKVDGYTYGRLSSLTHSIGDEIIYNNNKYYVIKNSEITDSTVTLLKAEPLTVEEVNTYGTGHINKYTESSVGIPYNHSGYGGMSYYTSETCGYVNGNWIYDGCTTDYEESDVKYVVDAWKEDQAPAASTARLIALNDLSNLGYRVSNLAETLTVMYGFSQDELEGLNEEDLWNLLILVDWLGMNKDEINGMTKEEKIQITSELVDEDVEDYKLNVNEMLSWPYNLSPDVPSWMWNENYSYWTMSQNSNANANVSFYIDFEGVVDGSYALESDNDYVGVIRPVITIKKSALTD